MISAKIGAGDAESFEEAPTEPEGQLWGFSKEAISLLGSPNNPDDRTYPDSPAAMNQDALFGLFSTIVSPHPSATASRLQSCTSKTTQGPPTRQSVGIALTKCSMVCKAWWLTSLPKAFGSPRLNYEPQASCLPAVPFLLGLRVAGAGSRRAGAGAGKITGS